MKKLVLICASIIVLLSCQKELLVPKSELPQWLIEKIEADEAVINENSKIWLAAGKWTRTEWQSEYYYEYDNILSSFLFGPISHQRDTLSIYDTSLIRQYEDEKCCEKLVWEGPSALSF